MADFTVRGSVKDSEGAPVRGVKVFAMYSDQAFFEDYNDDLLGSTWVGSDGIFELSFSAAEFTEGLGERNPDIYFVVRNSRGEIIHRTEPKRGAKLEAGQKDIPSFDIVLDSLEPQPGTATDPYARNIDRTLSAFGSLGDVATVNNSDFVRIHSLLNRSIDAWVTYTRENTWEDIGYDGPQVPLHPRATPHKHELNWEVAK
jgi:hypothetical protein